MYSCGYDGVNGVLLETDLESHRRQFELLLVDVQHTKGMPGHKTDIKDAEWTADFLQHGLLRVSFVPPVPRRHLRELSRCRSTMLAERARPVNRLHKVLEDTNLILTAVVTNILGQRALTCWMLFCQEKRSG
jgi:transposase